MRTVAPIFLLLAALAAGACSRGDRDKTRDEDVLVMVGDSALTRVEVVSRIPGGLAPEDSAAMFNSIVDAWVERLLLEEFGRENIEDMERIDRMTDAYRRRLIAETYRRDLREAHASGVSEERIRAYYDAHRDSLTLDGPVVKGVYLKLPSSATNIEAIRRWIFSGTPSGIDNLEKYGLREAVQYSFFEDEWTDWDRVAEQIPYRFSSPEEFLAGQSDFETEHGGITYLLHISDYLPAGAPMPREYAEPVIAAMLDTESAAAYERRLLKSLYSNARRQGRLKAVSFDPETHQPTGTNKTETNRNKDK